MGGNVKWYSYGKQLGGPLLSCKLKIQLQSNPAIPLLGIYSKEIIKQDLGRFLHTHVFHSQEVKTIQMSINDEWIKTIRYMYTMEHQATLKMNESLSHAITVYNVKDIILSQKTNILLFHSFEIPKVVKITDTGKKKKVDTTGGGGNQRV